MDVTNPLIAPPLRLAVGFDQSGGELVAQWSQGARVVKIFNTTGVGNMANPNYGGQAATMLYAGDDNDAKQVAAKLAADLGFDPIDAGPLASARYLEPFAMLWIDMALLRGYGTNFAFKLLTR